MVPLDAGLTPGSAGEGKERSDKKTGELDASRKALIFRDFFKPVFFLTSMWVQRNWDTWKS